MKMPIVENANLSIYLQLRPVLEYPKMTCRLEIVLDGGEGTGWADEWNKTRWSMPRSGSMLLQPYPYVQIILKITTQVD